MSPRPVRRPARAFAALAVAVLLGSGAAVFAPLAASAATTRTVTDATDDAAAVSGSLRWAIAQSASGDTIVFDPSVTALSITSTVVIPLGVTLDGGGAVTLSPGAGVVDALLQLAPTAADQDYTIENLALTGSGESRGIQVTSGTAAAGNVTLSHLAVSGFRKDVGAGIDVDSVAGTVTIDASTLSANTATGAGGSALRYTAPSGVALVISSSTITGNLTATGGLADGAVSFENSPAASITLTADTFTSNVVADGGFVFGAALGMGTDDGNSGPLTITDCVFRANGTTPSPGLATAYLGGAVAASRASAVTITGSTFDANEAQGGGGALFLDNLGSAAPIELRNDVISDNALPATGGNLGGGAFLVNNAGQVTMTGLSVTGNTASDGGGLAFENETGAFTISGSTFSGNTGETGGGFFVEEVFGDSSVSTSTFSGNTTSNFGGSGIFVAQVDADASFVVQSSTFTANSYQPDPPPAPGCGCGAAGLSMYVSDVFGEFGVAESTFDETSSPTAGYAILVDDVESTGTFGLANSTIAGDLGVDIGEIDGTLARVSHTIVQVPSGTDAITVDDPGSGPDLDVRWSLLSSGLGANETDTVGNQLNTDAQLATLASNGGATQTMLPQTGSPAIDAGDPAFSDPVTLDQRGLTRIVRVIDIGAVEVQALAPARLPATGVPIGGGAVVAMLLLLLGVGGLVLSRRRALS